MLIDDNIDGFKTVIPSRTSIFIRGYEFSGLMNEV
jgi:hypothetical protein